MSRKRVNVRPVAGGKPDVTVVFGGKNQSFYYDLLRIARDDFQIPQVTLARMVIIEWVKNYKQAGEKTQNKIASQLVMKFDGGA